MPKAVLEPQILILSTAFLACAACSGGETETVARIPLGATPASAPGSGESAMTPGSGAGTPPPGSSGDTPGSSAGANGGGGPVGVSPEANGEGTPLQPSAGATGGSGAMGTSAGATGDGESMVGAAGAPAMNPAGTAGTGAGGSGAAATTGHFEVLVFSKTAGYRHGSIAAGQTMLMNLGAQNDFHITSTEDAAIFTDQSLEPFQVVFFLNTTDDILAPTQQTAMENFIRKGRGFVGVHSATDTEDGFGWAWYQELVGSDYNGHGAANSPGTLTVDVGALNHPATRGLPQSWNRNEEWYLFKRDVSALPGVKVLLRYSEDNRPMAWTREWDGGRAFYTACGHDSAAFQEPLMQQHVLGGILWAARRAD